MKIEYKIFNLFLFGALSVPFLFFSYLLLRLEYNEHLVFGEIEQAKITNIETSLGSSSGEYGTVVKFNLELLNNSSDRKNFSIYSSMNNASPFKNDKELAFGGGANIGDVVTVKLVSNHQAKILRWKGIKINSKTNFWSITGRWFLILVLITIPTYIYYRLYKMIKIKTLN